MEATPRTGGWMTGMMMHPGRKDVVTVLAAPPVRQRFDSRRGTMARMTSPSVPPTRASVRLVPFLLLALLMLGAGLGLRDPSPPDEPRFVLSAQHMVESGNWLVPYRGSEMYSHKPPPFMWAQALSYLVVGDWRIAFLLPSLLAGLGTLWLVWDLAARLWRPALAPYAGFALLLSLQFALQAKRAQIDMLLVFCTTLALWALVRALLGGRDARTWWLGGFAAGFGTITKGVGFLPLLVLLPARWHSRGGDGRVWRPGAAALPPVPAWRHIGLYAYRAATLRRFPTLSPAPLEQVESLEQLRWLEAGYRISVAVTPLETPAVDTPEDLEKVRKLL